MKRIVIIVLSIAIVLGFLIWIFGPKVSSMFTSKQVSPITLEYWGLWEEESWLKPVIVEYQRQNPNVTINYSRKSAQNYRTRVQTQAREGVGPDVFRIHNSWLPMFEADIYPSPQNVFNLNDFRLSFYPIAEQSFVKGNQIFSVPYEIDGLALYINEDILNAAGGASPKNWREFIEMAKKMTVRDSEGIKIAGASLGTATNVDYWSDILGLLLLQQPKVDLVNPQTSEAAEVLRFYTSFVTDPNRKTWDVNLPSSTKMFADGKLGFYFGPSSKINEIKVLNPSLKFRVTPIPQLSSERTITWASFWGETVSKTSKHPVEAWQFVKFLTSATSQKLISQEAAKQNLSSKPYSQISLAPETINDPLLGAYVSQGPNYKSWYLSSNTLDVGINDDMIKFWGDAVTATLAGQDPLSALQVVDKGVKEVLGKYIPQ